MHLLEYYYKNIIRYDSINKFPKNNNLKNLPKLKKIVLNINCPNSDIKKFLSTSLFLELCTSNRTEITKYTQSDVIIKIKKGMPAGCKAILKGKHMYQFLNKLLVDVFPKIDNFKKLEFLKKNLTTSVFFSIKEITPVFTEFENYYDILNGTSIPKLNVTIVTDVQSKEEFIFLIESFKLPISIN